MWKVLGVVAALFVVLLGLLTAWQRNAHPRTVPAAPGLTIYVQNFDPAFVRDSVIRSDIPVWEQAANGRFREVWKTPRLRLVFVPSGQQPPKGAEVMQITANGPVQGAAAYHTQNNGRAAIVVYAGIDDAYGVSLSVAATHEIFERLADGATASINQGWPVDHFTVSQGQFGASYNVTVPPGQLMAQEVCDPVEEAHYTLRNAQGQPVWISDWVTPNYFNDHSTMPAGVPQFDYLGLVQEPLEVLPGGYQALYVIDLPEVTPEGSVVLYTGWISLTNFRTAKDAAFLVGERGRTLPFSSLRSN